MLYLVHPFASSRHFPSRGNEGYEALDVVSHMTQTANPVTLLAYPLGEEGHKVAKGWTVLRMIMILDVDVTVAGGLCHLGFLSLDMPAV